MMTKIVSAVCNAHLLGPVHRDAVAKQKTSRLAVKIQSTLLKLKEKDKSIKRDTSSECDAYLPEVVNICGCLCDWQRICSRKL